MNLLRTERDTLDSYIPGLDKYLSEIPLLELEKPGNGALRKFRELGGPALLVPAEYEGKGASLLDAVRIQRAVGSRSPSLAVATTMHHFSVASLVELTAAGNGFEWAMLMAIAENSWLLSSGFAEGKPGQHILTPTMRGAPADGGIIVTGVKKPCSLTWSMNLMSASVAVADPATGTDRLAVVLIPADSAGIERAPFWQTTALAAAESDQVTLTEVFVPEALIFYPQDGESMDPVQARGFVWFELLVSASYLGAATNLAERVIARGRGSEEDRAGLAIELETMAAALEQAACVATTLDDNDALLARALYARFATERAIERVAMAAAAALGGMSFIESPEIAYLLGAARALAFHPPSRAAAAGPIARYLAGGPLTLLCGIGSTSPSSPSEAGASSDRSGGRRLGCISALRSSSVAVRVLCPPRVGRIRNPDAGVLLWGDHMAPFVVALGIAGVILILVGLVGGGFTISTTAMPKVGNWVRVPCFGVGVVLVVAAVGLGFNNSNPLNPPNTPPSTSPAAVVTTIASPSPSPTDTSQEIATGIIYAPPGYSTIYVYSEPSPSSSVVASVADGITIGILCTSQGDVVTNEDTSQSSSLWDRTSEGFIPDVYVYTGTDQATMTNC